MHRRHTNNNQYFTEQSTATERYILPYIHDVVAVLPEWRVAEVGCGYGGNIKPFLDKGCQVVGIDISAGSIQMAQSLYENDPNQKNLQLIHCDIYKVTPQELPPFDLIFLRDTLEHIPHQEQFFEHIQSFLKPDGVLFLAFPPWRMPFGGHQQMCKNRFLSRLPFFHILPKWLYRFVLKLFGENEDKINSLLDIRETRLSIQRFYRIVKNQGLKIQKETFYLVNPNYQVKFGLKPRTLPRWLNIPVVRDFFTTVYYCVIKF